MFKLKNIAKDKDGNPVEWSGMYEGTGYLFKTSGLTLVDDPSAVNHLLNTNKNRCALAEGEEQLRDGFLVRNKTENVVSLMYDGKHFTWPRSGTIKIYDPIAAKFFVTDYKKFVEFDTGKVKEEVKAVEEVKPEVVKVNAVAPEIVPEKAKRGRKKKDANP
jgi:hypothetical protein